MDKAQALLCRSSQSIDVEGQNRTEHFFSARRSGDMTEV
jgi:hypothetical protein